MTTRSVIATPEALAPGTKSERHYSELDGLRGLAAFVVVFHHYVLLGSPTRFGKLFFHVVANGHSAVILFFVLADLFSHCP